MTKTYQKYRTRIAILIGFVLFSWVSICLRLFQVQILNGHTYQKAVIKQSQTYKEISSNRGNIFDRNERPLTRNIIHYTISANPKKVLNKNKISKALSKYTGKPEKEYLSILNSKGNFKYLERNLKNNPLDYMPDVDFEGLNIHRDYRRFYPHKKIAAQILGYTDSDEIGISGIERNFNNYLTGKSGWTYKTKGWSGKVQRKNGLPYKKPINGSNIQLTIDLDYQSILEDELTRRQIETNSISATGLIVNPQTGEILAIASTPGFDNNNFTDTDPNFHRIRSITDQFEPGSTFKSFSAASALDNNKIGLNEEFNCENGEYLYYNIPIRDHEKKGMLTLSQIIQNSSNVGIVKIAERIGAKSLYNTSRNFGFGSKTGISLEGETSGKLNKIKYWSAVSLGQIAMGHEVGVTALQITMAYCAIANGGYLIKPRLIKQILNSKNEVIYKEEPSVIRKIRNNSDMDEICKMLRKVVSNGTGQNAEINGWDIAGKTGTAQKFKNGKYSDDQFISNFVGFFPFKNPQILAFVMLDEPEAPYHWGAEGAAVAFNRIIKRIIRMDDAIKPPVDTNKNHIEKLNMLEVITMNKNIDMDQEISKKAPIYLSTRGTNSNKIKMPELRGYSLKKAINQLKEHKLKIKINGSGTVFWQSPKPGDLVFQGSTCTVGLK
tara:strand:- start:410 stop:2401 length:1992 start_codon:yes stop_codon:yes gene_type:complete